MDDRGLAALAEAEHDYNLTDEGCSVEIDHPWWCETRAVAILGERAVFLPDGLADTVWWADHYRTQLEAADADIARLRTAGDALAKHLRLWTVAPSGTHICTCRGTGKPRCWYCDARDLYLSWEDSIDGR
jgi:hypothetical protein